MELTNKQEQLIAEFYKYLGLRFPTIEAASPDAPITICAYDNDNKPYYIFLDDKLEQSVYQFNIAGIGIENVHFYNLYGMCSEGLNVFHMTLCSDGYILYYINDTLTPDQINVGEDFTIINGSSALHVELPKKLHLPKLSASFSDFNMN